MPKFIRGYTAILRGLGREIGILGTYLWEFWGHTYRERVSILRVEMGILGTYLWKRVSILRVEMGILGTYL